MKKVLGLQFIIYILVLAAAVMQLLQFRSTKTFVEDALAASNLASAVIDLSIYGIDHEIVIAEPDKAYLIYQEALKANMLLDDNYECEYKNAVAGRVEILDYVIYNVRGSDVTIYSYGQNPYYMFWEDGLGSVTAPNGEIVASTAIYSKVSFPVEGLFDIKFVAAKDKLVDVVD